MSLIMSFSGTTETLELHDDRVVITGASKLSILRVGGSKTLYMNQITGVQFKSATAFSPGWLHFVLPGDRDMMQWAQGAAANDNAVLFKKKDNETAEQLKVKVEELIASANSATGNPVSGADEILKYKSLLDQGVITEAEFEQQKKKLLGL